MAAQERAEFSLLLKRMYDRQQAQHAEALAQQMAQKRAGGESWRICGSGCCGLHVPTRSGLCPGRYDRVNAVVDFGKKLKLEDWLKVAGLLLALIYLKDHHVFIQSCLDWVRAAQSWHIL